MIESKSQAFLFRNTKDTSVFVITEPGLVSIIEEYINLEIDKIPFKGEFKRNLIAKIDHVIDLLESDSLSNR